MAALLITNTAFVLPTQSTKGVSILIANGVISRIIPAGEQTEADEIVDVGALTVFAGFIDVHIHGAVGVDVNAADVEGLLTIAEFLARNGVTAWVPTLVPDSDENYRRTISEIDKLMDLQEGKPVAQAVGVHYEGVFANEKMCGALRPEFFKKFTGPTTPSADHPAAEAAAPLLKPGGESNPATPPPAGGELLELPRLKRGIHMMTFAPEVAGGVELAKELKRQGWIAAIGHTKADVETLDKAFEAGARHCTHFYNAMTGLHHREVGVVGWALTNPKMTFDIIADGEHVHPKMLEFACRSKTPENVSLISDSVAATGLGDGVFEIWGEKVVVENGITKNERGSIAGSVITMLDAVKRMRSLGFSDTEVSRMASLNPAKLLGIEKEYGSIEVGKRADLVALDGAGVVKFVMIGGETVTPAS